MTDGAEAVADELFDHLRRYEVPEHLLAKGAVHYLNFVDQERPAGHMARMLGLERRIVAESRLHLQRRSFTEDGFVLQMVSSGITTSGVDFRVPVCLVVTVAEGRITRLDEYADSRQAQPLLDEVLALQPHQ